MLFLRSPLAHGPDPLLVLLGALLLDALLGDPTLFARHDFVENSWALITPVHQMWEASGLDSIPTYEAGEWGPPEADRLMQADGRRWRTL